MTLLYERPDGKPGTHALVIGVGHYLHLPLGGKKLAKNALGLKQLTSPPVSAAAVLKWLLAPTIPGAADGFHNSVAPLASVEAVISAPQEVEIQTAGGPVKVESAIADNIVKAHDAWLARLQANEANIGLLYYCGHGVNVDAQDFILASDFGADDNKPWRNAINLSDSLFGLMRKVHGALFVVVDACREFSKELALQRYGEIRQLAGANLQDKVTCVDFTHISSAGEGSQAFADPDAVSRFTAALLEALGGYAGEKRGLGNEWMVTGEELAKAVRGLLKARDEEALEAEIEDYEPQVVENKVAGRTGPLVTLDRKPRVKVCLRLGPKDKCASARLLVKPVKDTKESEYDASTGKAALELDKGVYDLAVVSSSAAFKRVDWEDTEIACPCFHPPPHQIAT